MELPETRYGKTIDGESYEVTMKDSGRPETDAFAKQMAAMSDAPPTFANYDVVHEEAVLVTRRILLDVSRSGY